MLKKRGFLLLLIVLLQLAVLVFMVANSYIVVLKGEKIELQVIPIDPHSLFQGEYVRLGYAINQLDLTKIEHDLDLENITFGQRIYLTLEQQNGTWTPVMITNAKNKAADKLFIEGKATYLSPAIFPEKTESTPDYQPTMTILNATWGIEQFFVPEGQGKQIEEQVLKGEIYAQISVYKGKARVTGLVDK